MLPGLRVSRSLRLLPEYRSSALSTDVTAGADSACRFMPSMFNAPAPRQYEKTSAEVGNARKSAHYHPHLRTPFPFDFEFFVVAIPLNVRGIILVTNNSFATNLRKPKKTHRADNTWRNTTVITERSGDIFPDRSRNAIVKFVHGQLCQPVIDRRVEGFQLRRGKVITCVGNHFFRRIPG